MRVLVVDDDLPVVETICRLIQKLGHEALGVTNGLSALEVFRRAPYDVVVVDLVMPDMNGLEVLRRLRAIDGDARLVALTGVFPELVQMLGAKGIPLVPKPIVTASDARALIEAA